MTVKTGPKPVAILTRLLAKVEVEDHGFTTPCWIYYGRRNAESGYGQIHCNSAPRTRSVHRVTYEEFIGPVAGQLDHLCRQRACCNPEHLEDTDQTTNVRRGLAPRVVLSQADECLRGHRLSENAVKAGKFRRCRVCRDEYRARYYALNGR